MSEGVAHPLELLLGRLLTVAGVDLTGWLVQALARRGPDELDHAFGELCLKFRGLAAVDPLPAAGKVAGRDELVDQRLRPGVPQQLCQRSEERVDRHAGAAAALRLGEHVQNAGAGAPGS